MGGGRVEEGRVFVRGGSEGRARSRRLAAERGPVVKGRGRGRGRRPEEGDRAPEGARQGTYGTYARMSGETVKGGRGRPGRAAKGSRGAEPWGRPPAYGSFTVPSGNPPVSPRPRAGETCVRTWSFGVGRGAHRGAVRASSSRLGAGSSKSRTYVRKYVRTYIKHVRT